MWEALRDRASLFGGAVAWRPQRFVIGAGADAIPANGIYVSGELFATLGIKPVHGRLFKAEDDRVGGGDAGVIAVISSRLWQRRFARSPNVVGSSLAISGVPVTIVGVTPPEFLGLETGKPFDVALPIGAEPIVQGRAASLLRPRTYQLFVLLRLADAQTVETATTTLRRLQPDIIPAGGPAFLAEPFTLEPLGGGMGPTSPERIYGQPLVILLGGMAAVLLVASLNIANLMLARAISRRPEISLRLAVGAPRWRIARAFMIDGLVLAVLGGVLGLLFAVWGSRALISLTGVDLPTVLDWRVIGFTAAISTGALLLFGLAPAVRSSRAEAAASIRPDLSARVIGGPQHLSRWLVALQIALALVLVIGAGLLGRTLRTLAGRPLGLDAERVLIADVDAARLPDSPSRILIDRLVSAAAAVPGVERAAASRWTPLSGQGGLISMSADEISGPSETGSVNVLTNFVSPGWFAAYGTPVKAGRDFTDADVEGAPGVVVVNEAFVHRFFRGETGTDRLVAGRVIVGVVGDAVYRSSERIPGMSSLAFREPVPPTIYAPLAQVSGWNQLPASGVFVSVRARGDAADAIGSPLRAALSRVDPSLSIQLRSLGDDAAASLAQERLSASVSMFFAMLAALLAMVGLYGVTSYAASRRLAEIGIRLALGATRAGVATMMLRQAIVMVAVGVATGLVAALLLTRVLSSLVFGISLNDAATYVVATVILTLAAIVAVLVPAYRASRTDPATVLRQ
jgi:predicted permease